MKKKSDLQIRDLIVTIVEKNLILMGKRTHDKVINCLKNEYHCKVSNCYAKPEILNSVLKKKLGKNMSVFMDTMAKDLAKINHDEEIKHFLDVFKHD